MFLSNNGLSLKRFIFPLLLLISCSSLSSTCLCCYLLNFPFLLLIFSPSDVFLIAKTHLIACKSHIFLAICMGFASQMTYVHLNPNYEIIAEPLGKGLLFQGYEWSSLDRRMQTSLVICFVMSAFWRNGYL